MADFLNNALIQLFDNIETNSGVTFSTFCTNDTGTTGNLTATNQPYMKQYKAQQDNKVYKYLYDPDLAFDYRFHQRLANIHYADRKEPWVTLIFNTKELKPLTNILSNKQKGYLIEEETNIVHNYKIKRVIVPINFILLSNDMTYLYETTEKVACYFDRFINYHYNEVITLEDGYKVYWEEVGYASEITEQDLNKLDTQFKGSLVSSAYSFNLCYPVTEFEGTTSLLEKIIVEFKAMGSGETLFLSITE